MAVADLLPPIGPFCFFATGFHIGPVAADKKAKSSSFKNQLLFTFATPE
jgi:hypothetical protein